MQNVLTGINSALGHVATFSYACGHSVDMTYSSKAFAEEDRARQEAGLCFHCQSRAILEKMLAPRDLVR